VKRSLTPRPIMTVPGLTSGVRCRRILDLRPTCLVRRFVVNWTDSNLDEHFHTALMIFSDGSRVG
jgi:hypothetical protein